jgi:hypothetical protein
MIGFLPFLYMYDKIILEQQPLNLNSRTSLMSACVYSVFTTHLVTGDSSGRGSSGRGSGTSLPDRKCPRIEFVDPKLRVMFCQQFANLKSMKKTYASNHYKNKQIGKEVVQKYLLPCVSTNQAKMELYTKMFLESGDKRDDRADSLLNVLASEFFAASNSDQCNRGSGTDSDNNIQHYLQLWQLTKQDIKLYKQASERQNFMEWYKQDSDFAQKQQHYQTEKALAKQKRQQQQKPLIATDDKIKNKKRRLNQSKLEIEKIGPLQKRTKTTSITTGVQSSPSSSSAEDLLLAQLRATENKIHVKMIRKKTVKREKKTKLSKIKKEQSKFLTNSAS